MGHAKEWASSNSKSSRRPAKAAAHKKKRNLFKTSVTLK